MPNLFSVQVFFWSVSLLLTIPSVPAAAEFGATRQPNVIYILADDLGYGELSCYGQEKIQTPNLDRLASEGMRFTQHYSGNTVCTPSRACLMTGQHPGRVYVRGNLREEKGAALDPEMVVLPEIFKAAGYATGAFGKWGLGETHRDDANNPLSHGFDEFRGWKSQTIAHTYYPSTMVANGEEVTLEPGTYIHDILMEEAMRFMRQHAGTGTPFFCYIPTAVPHAAMHAPEALHEKWRARFAEFDHEIGRYSAGPEDCPDVRNPKAGFAAMMENLDNQIGEILDMLEEAGIADNTLVLFSSDNGPHREGGHNPRFWNSSGGLRGMKRDLYEGGIRVPFLAWWPGTVAAGSESDHISAFWDVVPTMSQLTGQQVPEQSQGISFLPTLLGRPDLQEVHKYLYWEFWTSRPTSKGSPFSRAVRVGDWKGFQKEGSDLELYNLAEDLSESANLAEAHPEIVAAIEAIFEEASEPIK